MSAPEAPSPQSAEEAAPVKIELRDDCLGDCLRRCQPFAEDLDRCKEAYRAGCFGENPAADFDCSPFLEPETEEPLDEGAPSKKSQPASAEPKPEPAELKRGTKRSDPGLKMVD